MMNNYAFIDSQNLNLSILGQGWKLDFKRFRIYLSGKHNVKKAFLFIGYIATNESLYTSLQDCGYLVVFKPTLILPNGKPKGNVDAELVLHTMIEYPNYDKAVVVSGDGDYYCLIEYLKKKGKLERVIIPNKNKYSYLLSKFSPQLSFMNKLKGKLEYK